HTGHLDQVVLRVRAAHRAPPFSRDNGDVRAIVDVAGEVRVIDLDDPYRIGVELDAGHVAGMVADGVNDVSATPDPDHEDIRPVREHVGRLQDQVVEHLQLRQVSVEVVDHRGRV